MWRTIILCFKMTFTTHNTSAICCDKDTRPKKEKKKKTPKTRRRGKNGLMGMLVVKATEIKSIIAEDHLDAAAKQERRSKKCTT